MWRGIQVQLPAGDTDICTADDIMVPFVAGIQKCLRRVSKSKRKRKRRGEPVGILPLHTQISSCTLSHCHLMILLGCYFPDDDDDW